jgi:hypothetical protein
MSFAAIYSLRVIVKSDMKIDEGITRKIFAFANVEMYKVCIR